MLIRTPATQHTAVRQRTSAPSERDPDSEPSRSIIIAAIGLLGILLVLIWVMKLEATLPSIRIDEQSSATGTSTTLDPGTYLAENPAIAFSGNWFKQTLGTSTPPITTTSMVTDAANSRLSFRFYGTELSMTARVGPESGKVHVTVDGQESPILASDSTGSFVDLYGNQAENQSILLDSGLAHRDHTVVITSDGPGAVAISGFVVTANTPFPWAFVVLYVALTGALFVVVRRTVIATCRWMGWI